MSRLIDADKLPKYTGYALSAAEVAMAVVNAPTVDPVKHGRWVGGKCSICGEHAPFWCMASTYYPSKYCPGCGATMDEVSE